MLFEILQQLLCTSFNASRTLGCLLTAYAVPGSLSGFEAIKLFVGMHTVVEVWQFEAEQWVGLILSSGLGS